ncbi:MAG: hypothetical protein C0408_07805 [Odoribacter sp.]|nr:hypothetical protein [Odoribacter sp.]
MIMTLNSNNPWAGIERPISGFSVVRVDSEHPHDFFWGKDTQGAFLLLLEIDKQYLEFLEKQAVDLKGVSTDLRLNPSTGGHFFILCLQNKENADIFHRLCMDLIDRTKDVKEQKVALEIIHTRLKRWQSFLSRKTNHLLTAQEVQGLYAELEFLYICISKTDNQLAVIEGWQGPLGGPQDYVLGDYAVEVKSVAGLQKNVVRISSENQLGTHLDRLYLQVFFLAEFYACKLGLSLNQMVDKVRSRINDIDTRDLFDNRLYETGYIELKDYDTPCYSVTCQKTYEVQEGFPRIIPDALSDGLTNVSYDLGLNSLESYICDFPFDGGDK